jgi:hypothetical protein
MFYADRLSVTVFFEVRTSNIGFRISDFLFRMEFTLTLLSQDKLRKGVSDFL